MPHEDHLDIYEDRYELHQGGQISLYREGPQNSEAQLRYKSINYALEHDYLEKQMELLNRTNFSQLSEPNRILLRNMVNGITSEVGRALVGLAFLQLTVKSLTPEQCIRLHKGSVRPGSFSWEDGISMRTIDSNYITPFLRKHELLKVNKYGIMMTRSLAENYPYSRLYKAEMRGPFNDWIAIVDALEDHSMPPEQGLRYMMVLLKNHSDAFRLTASYACDLAEQYPVSSLEQVEQLFSRFFNQTDYSARAFEVVLHGLFQAMDELHLLGDAEIVPMSQMRSANKKHGNVGDIELTERGVIVEAWDAKYGKPYLRDELEELRDKLLTHPDVRVAGFIVNTAVDTRPDVIRRRDELAAETGAEIQLFSFEEWVTYETHDLSGSQKATLGTHWLCAVTESFAQRRFRLAPIDEPCDAWLRDLSRLMEPKFSL